MTNSLFAYFQLGIKYSAEIAIHIFLIQYSNKIIVTIIL